MTESPKPFTVPADLVAGAVPSTPFMLGAAPVETAAGPALNDPDDPASQAITTSLSGSISRSDRTSLSVSTTAKSDLAPTPDLAFVPVEVRARADGWTPGRQRAFVEELADCGIIREAAGRVGMSEQAVTRLRRRAGSDAFVAACEAALVIATHRVRSVIFERAVNGYIKGHYYHGELVSEERVFDHRLLSLLLGKTGLLADPNGRVATADRAWSGIADAAEERAAGIVPVAARKGRPEVWEERGRRWTRFPAPDGFRGTQRNDFGHPDYRRTLTLSEDAAMDDRNAVVVALEHRRAARERDAFFALSAPAALPCGARLPPPSPA